MALVYKKRYGYRAGRAAGAQMGGLARMVTFNIRSVDVGTSYHFADYSEDQSRL